MSLDTHTISNSGRIKRYFSHSNVLQSQWSCSNDNPQLKKNPRKNEDEHVSSTLPVFSVSERQHATSTTHPKNFKVQKGLVSTPQDPTHWLKLAYSTVQRRTLFKSCRLFSSHATHTQRYNPHSACRLCSD